MNRRPRERMHMYEELCDAVTREGGGLCLRKVLPEERETLILSKGVGLLNDACRENLQKLVGVCVCVCS